MSATFYPAKQLEPNSFTYVGEEHINLSNSNARFILSGLGYNSSFEEHDTTKNSIDTLIAVIERYFEHDLFYQAYREREIYAYDVLNRIWISMIKGKAKGATHWYAC